ncbi:MAG: calcium/sodium antiporter [Deltaproteobacteria bacterium]|nr:calcium/sodium antiporter [Deltaproteobacteria bacterium]
MLADVLSLLGGLLLLYVGAEALVKGGVGLALAVGASHTLIGLTVVAFGTSLPELSVSVTASSQGRGAVVLGNVLGSNIANLGVVLGLTALLVPTQVDASLQRREVPALLLSALAVPALLRDGRLDRGEAGLLVLSALVLLGMMARAAMARALGPPGHATAELAEGERPPAHRATTLLQLSMIFVGLLALVGGGHLFVQGAVGVARYAGMSDRLVGLTVVAVGTSLPEFSASVVAAWRGHAGLAVGNVVGSNIFNVLLILGVTGLARPVVAAPGQTELAAFLGLTVLAVWLLRRPRTLRRIEGAALVALFAVFLTLLATGR